MKNIIVVLFLFGFINQGFSQTNATTENGEKVILNENGTWKYAISKVDKQKDCDFSTSEKEKLVLNSQKIGGWGKFALNGYLSNQGDSITFYCNYEGDLGTVDQNSYAIVKFEDNSTIELKGLNRIDKSKTPVFIANIYDPYIFSRKKVTKIKLFLSKNFSDIILSDKEFFIKSLKCLE
jgi:hypothetical protein